MKYEPVQQVFEERPKDDAHEKKRHKKRVLCHSSMVNSHLSSKDASRRSFIKKTLRSHLR
jgi:hypothetical protein